MRAARLRGAGEAVLRGADPRASLRVTTTEISVAVPVTVMISWVPETIRICSGIGFGLAVYAVRKAAVTRARLVSGIPNSRL